MFLGEGQFLKALTRQMTPEGSADITITMNIIIITNTNLEASATAADPSSIDVICRLGGKGQATPVKH